MGLRYKALCLDGYANLRARGIASMMLRLLNATVGMWERNGRRGYQRKSKEKNTSHPRNQHHLLQRRRTHLSPDLQPTVEAGLPPSLQHREVVRSRSTTDILLGSVLPMLPDQQICRQIREGNMLGSEVLVHFSPKRRKPAFLVLRTCKRILSLH